MRPRLFAAALALACGLAGPAWPNDGASATPGTGPVAPALAQTLPAAAPKSVPVIDAVPATTRSGVEIYRRFREGLADPTCEPGASSRWRKHFAHAPGLLASANSDVLPLFGYVVDRLRAEHLPTEYALIPFVESGYRPGARSPQGPAGLWQFIALTARNHKVPVRAGYDGRLSPVDSTDAAVRYLKTLHGMFAGDWRLTVMAYNAGEYRLLGALKRAGQRPAAADPASLPMPAITLAYVRKLHALSCLFEEADDRDAWLASLDRPVPVLAAAEVPAGVATLDALSRQHGADIAQLRRLNPVYGDGRIAHAHGKPRILLPSAFVPAAPAVAGPTPSVATDAMQAAGKSASDADISDAMADASAHVAQPPRTHVVVRGDSAWRIAKRYGVRPSDLLARNRLDAGGTLRPGMVLAIDTPADGASATAVAE